MAATSIRRSSPSNPARATRVDSVTITDNYLSPIGDLAVGGTLTFGSLINDGTDIQGYGRIATAGTLDNTGTIIGGSGATGLVIDAAVLFAQDRLSEPALDARLSRPSNKRFPKARLWRGPGAAPLAFLSNAAAPRPSPPP